MLVRPLRSVTPQHQMSGTGSRLPWRLELFFKSEQELASQLEFLKRHNIKRVNIPNKKEEDDLEACVKILKNAIPDIDICCHFSCKNQYKASPESSLQKLVSLCSTMSSTPETVTSAAAVHDVLTEQDRKRAKLESHAIDTPSDQSTTNDSVNRSDSSPAAACNNGHVLIVSGGGKKRKTFNTMSVLQVMRQRGPTQTKLPVNKVTTTKMNISSQTQASAATGSAVPLMVAFNPYLPDPNDRQVERQRLKDKIQTGLVAGVYLQIGTDLAALRSGLEHLNACLPQRPPNFQVYGSILLPSKRLLAQMKFRPWNGVFLSEEYLSGVEAAERITNQVLEVYAANGVVPLFESSVKTDAEFSYLNKFLTAYTSALPNVKGL